LIADVGLKGGRTREQEEEASSEWLFQSHLEDGYVDH